MIASVIVVLLCLLRAYTIQVEENQSTKKNRSGNSLTILGLFAYTIPSPTFYIDQSHDVANGTVVEAAVRLALMDINSSTNILNGTILNLHTVDTECDPAKTIWIINKYALQDTISPVIVLGPPCDESATGLVKVTNKFTNIITVSYEAETLELTNAVAYRSFFQTIPSFLDLYRALGTVLTRFKWQKICLIVEDKLLYQLAAEKLDQYFRHENYNIVILESITATNFKYVNDTFCRIFIVLSTEIYFPTVLCTALRNGFVTRSYQWIYLKGVQTNLTGNNSQECTQIELLEAKQQSLVIEFSDFIYSTGNSKSEFDVQLTNYLQKNQIAINDVHNKQHNFLTAASAYDATWTIALGINASLQSLSQNGWNLSDYLPNSNSNVSTILITGFETVKFDGILRKVDFTSERHYIYSDILISQWQDTIIVPISLVMANGTTSWDYYNKNFSWIGGAPPIDSPVIVQADFPLWAQYVLFTLSIAGCSFVAAMFIINSYFRNHRVIKASSPCINNIILLGTFLGFISIILIVLMATNYLNDQVRSLFCNMSVWLVNLTFTIAFGSLLTKTWRVYAVFRNPWTKHRIYKDPILLLVIIGMVLFESTVLITWTVIAPMSLTKLYISSPDITIEIAFCKVGDYGEIFIIILLVYKTLLILLGCFLALKTRRIKYQLFNDSKYIAMAIYGLFLTNMIGVPVSIFTINEQMVWSYLVINMTIFTSSLLIICTVFIPKLLLLYKHRHNMKLTSSSTKSTNTQRHSLNQTQCQYNRQNTTVN